MYGGPERTWCKYIITSHSDLLSRYSELLSRYNDFKLSLIESFFKGNVDPYLYVCTIIYGIIYNIMQYMVTITPNEVFFVHLVEDNYIAIFPMPFDSEIRVGQGYICDI